MDSNQLRIFDLLLIEADFFISCYEFSVIMVTVS